MAAVYADHQELPAGGGAAVAVRDSERVGDPHHEASPGRPLALVVEPDPALRQEIAGALRTHGMGVVEAEDGLDALLELSHRAPDLVVLDMDITQVSGHRLFRVLRSAPETRHAPVVMLSHGACQEVCPSPREGPLPDCFLQKPVSPATVVRELVRTADLSALRRG